MKLGFQSDRSDGRFCVDILSIPNVVGQKRNINYIGASCLSGKRQFLLYRGNSERVHETHTSEVHQRDYETGTSEDHQRVGENGTFESTWGKRLSRWNYLNPWDLRTVFYLVCRLESLTCGREPRVSRPA